MIFRLMHLAVLLGPLFVGSETLNAQSLKQVEISRLIQQLNAMDSQAFGLLKNYCDPSDEAEDYTPALVREKQIALKCPLTTASLCAQVGRECSLRHSQDPQIYTPTPVTANSAPPVQRFSNPAPPVNQYTNPVPVGERYTSDDCLSPFSVTGDAYSERSKKVLKESASIFYAMTSDDSEGSLQKICCDKGLNTEQVSICKNEFQQTRLVLLENTTQAIGRAHRNADGNYIEVSRAILETCLNQECVERLFIHELGHSCDSSRRVARDLDPHPYGFLKAEYQFSCSEKINDVGHFNLIERKTAECITSRLDLFSAQAERDHQNVCLSAWRAEAFADAIFVEKYNSFAHFAWNCLSPQNRLHAQSKIYLSCLIEQPKVHDHFCPKK